MRVLDHHHELLVIGLVLHQSDMYLREICQSIHSTSGVNVSEPTLCRILQKHGLTRKKIRQEAIQRCSMLRGCFLAEMTTFQAEQLIWIDESGCKNKDSIRTAGYALRGMTPVRTRFLVKGKHVLCIAAIACDGLIALEATTTTYSGCTNFL